jgi:hypothetical protein
LRSFIQIRLTLALTLAGQRRASDVAGVWCCAVLDGVGISNWFDLR